MDSFERPNSNPIATQQQHQPNTWPTMMMTTMFATTTKTRSKFQTEHWSRQTRMRFLHSQCIFSNKASAELQQQLMVFFRRARNSVSKPKFELYLHSKYRYKRVPICIHTHRIQLQTACVLFSFGFFISSHSLFVCIHWLSLSSALFFSLSRNTPYQTIWHIQMQFCMHTEKRHTLTATMAKRTISAICLRDSMCVLDIFVPCVFCCCFVLNCQSTYMIMHSIYICGLDRFGCCCYWFFYLRVFFVFTFSPYGFDVCLCFCQYTVLLPVALWFFDGQIEWTMVF